MEIAGIIMAGGKSSRMGSDKGLMLYKEKPLIYYPLTSLKNLCSEILISTNNSEYAFFGHQLVNDEYTNIGPMGGLYSSLLASKNTWNVVVACDMPFISTKFIARLISEIDDDFDAVVPQNANNQYETLCAAYSKTCISQIQQKITKQEFGLHRLLSNLKVKTIEIKEDDRNFINLNTLNEFQRAEKDI